VDSFHTNLGCRHVLSFCSLGQATDGQTDDDDDVKSEMKHIEAGAGSDINGESRGSLVPMNPLAPCNTVEFHTNAKI